MPGVSEKASIGINGTPSPEGESAVYSAFARIQESGCGPAGEIRFWSPDVFPFKLLENTPSRNGGTGRRARFRIGVWRVSDVIQNTLEPAISLLESAVLLATGFNRIQRQSPHEFHHKFQTPPAALWGRGLLSMINFATQNSWKTGSAVIWQGSNIVDVSHREPRIHSPVLSGRRSP